MFNKGNYFIIKLFLINCIYILNLYIVLYYKILYGIICYMIVCIIWYMIWCVKYYLLFWYNIIGVVIFEIFILKYSDCIYWVNLSKVGLFKNSIGKIMIMVWILNEFRFKVYIIFEVSFMLGI